MKKLLTMLIVTGPAIAQEPLVSHHLAPHPGFRTENWTNLVRTVDDLTGSVTTNPISQQKIINLKPYYRIHAFGPSPDGAVLNAAQGYSFRGHAYPHARCKKVLIRCGLATVDTPDGQLYDGTVRTNGLTTTKRRFAKHLLTYYFGMLDETGKPPRKNAMIREAVRSIKNP